MDIKTAIYHYCNYQERCHSEVRNKLYELGAKTTQVNELMAALVEDDLLNEERFARSYARGKFRLKQWGKVKIALQLKQRQVSEYCIKKGLAEIDTNEYFDTLVKLARKKWEELKTERSARIKKAKLVRYLLQKGYEYSKVQEACADNLLER